jgi:nitrous oxidase accessory protein NosD
MTMTVRRLLALGALVLLPLTGLAAAGPAEASPTSPALPSTVYVATTGSISATCGSSVSPCKTITEGLARVSPGGTIHVGPGTYAEQVVIAHSVSIVGAGAATVIDPTILPTTDSDTDSATPQDAIVDVRSGVVGVSLSSLTINGAGASGSIDAAGCPADFVGVYFHSSSGSLEDVTVKNVALPPALPGCPAGQGVYVDAAPGAHANVSIDHSSVVGYQEDGIACDDAGTYCTITDTTVTGIGPTDVIAQNGIQIWSGSADLTGDTVSQNTYTDPLFSPGNGTTIPPSGYAPATGVLVINAGAFSMTGNHVSANDDDAYLREDTYPGDGFDPPGAPPALPWTIVNNTFSDATTLLGPGLGMGDGIDLDSTSQPVLISDNTASADPEFGIALLGAAHASVDANTLDGDGVGLFGADGTGLSTAGTYASDDLVTFNTIQDSDLDGIFFYPGVSGLTLLGNTALGTLAGPDSGPDVYDASTGGGTEGTANYWIDNACSTSSPAGLCTTSHPVHRILPFFGFGRFGHGYLSGFWRW